MPALDSIDRNILRLLRLDARMSNAKLAAEIGLSPSACLRRIKIMEKSGVIRGYTVLVDTGNADEMIAVIINITLERQTEDYLDRLEAAVRLRSRDPGMFSDDGRFGLPIAGGGRQCGRVRADPQRDPFDLARRPQDPFQLLDPQCSGDAHEGLKAEPRSSSGA